jgi:hypothetical protein
VAPGPGIRDALTGAGDQTSHGRTGGRRCRWAGRLAEFKVGKGRDGRYYWHLQAASNRIIARPGQACDSKCWCVQDLNWLRANAGLIMVTTTPESLHQDRRAKYQPDRTKENAPGAAVLLIGPRGHQASAPAKSGSPHADHPVARGRRSGAAHKPRPTAVRLLQNVG